jgi:hypothetical protein
VPVLISGDLGLLLLSFGITQASIQLLGVHPLMHIMANMRMKNQVDNGCVERQFDVGDQVFLKLHAAVHSVITCTPCKLEVMF